MRVIAGADVTLFRSAMRMARSSRFRTEAPPCPPANRDNPDQTDGSGHFGWDVIAGYYKVEASAPGCATASTSVLNIPPPVTNLDIRLSCPTGGGGGQPQQPLSTAPASKKCKKKKKGRSAVAAKKCKKKKGRSAAASASRAFEAQGLLFVGVSETK